LLLVLYFVYRALRGHSNLWRVFALQDDSTVKQNTPVIGR